MQSQAQENTPGYEAGNTPRRTSAEEDGSTTPGNPVTVPQKGDTKIPLKLT
ncbi:hypothetical protein [Staphylococcus felis]|uniref:hypothetical protein n=1 Tax=Staphylococcus felis TaxID=46127 RepID=UPI0032DA56CD